MRSKLGRLIALTGALAFAACGSTVPLSQRPHAASGREGLGTAGSATESGTGIDQSAAGGAGAGAGVSGAGAGTSGGGSAAGGSTSGGVAGVAPLAPGSRTPVEIGIGVDSNQTAFAAAFGVSTAQPDEKVVAAAIVADINKHGGLAGHPIVPVYTVFDNTSSDWIAQDQASCATFTQDHHVIAAVRTDDIFGPLDTCLANAGIPLVLYESYFRAPSWFRTAPGLRFVPDNPAPARLYAALAGRMAATNRWAPSSKIGLVRYDRGDQAEIETQAVRPALAARGFKLTDAEAVHTPESFQDIGATSSQMAAVVLKFRQLGIDNVMFEGGDLSYLFSTAAQSQQYAPRYALTSFDFPNGMADSQLHGAFGVGWEPSDDLKTVIPTTPGMARCQAVTRSTGADYATAGADRIYTACDQLYFLEAAYNAAGNVGSGALALGVKRLAGGLAAAFTFAIDASAHPDGAAAYRDLSYDERCACLAYGPQFPLP